MSDLRIIIPPPTVLGWDDVAEALRVQAHVDLERTRGDGGLYLAAARGDDLLLIAVSRPFEARRHDRVIVELGSLALGLGADRVAVAVTGRAWSMDDPIVPVADGVDLRSRVLVVHRVDGTVTPVGVGDTILPFEMRGRRAHWSEPVDLPAAEGWIPGALRAAVSRRAELSCSPVEARQQRERCESLGHLLYLTPHGLQALVRDLELGDMLTDVLAEHHQRLAADPGHDEGPAGAGPIA